MGYLKKRGQITIFIILGILILMGSAAYFYIKQKSTNFEPNTVELKKTTVLHPFVEACLEQKTREALGIIGSTGGYISFPTDIKQDPASYLKLAPFEEAKMPFWWYAGEVRIPPLDYIQGEVETYVKDHLEECINNFSSINGYDVYKTGNISVQLTFADNDIDVKLKYPLRAVKVPEQNEFELNDYDFFVKIPIRFKEIYGVAEKIMKDEDQDYFMEKWTMDLISLDDTGAQSSTPLMNVDLRLRPYVWKFSTVRNELKELLYRNTQYIKFEGTDYTKIPDTMPYIQNHFVWNFEQQEEGVTVKHPGITASVTYDPKWDMRFDVSPTKGTMLKSGNTQVGGVLSFIGIQIWHFTYDVVYPVMITVKDNGNKRSDPYTFSYPFQVSIQDNNPYRKNFGSTIFVKDDMPSEEEACDYLKTNFDTEITVSTYNEFNEKILSGVNLTFTCGRYTCPIGRTKVANNGATAQITAMFPHCPWGILRGYKEGYEDAQMFMSANENKWVELNMRPVKEITNVTVVKHLYVKNSHTGEEVGKEENLFDGEQAIVLISSDGIKDQFVTFPINDSDIIMPLKFYKDKEFSYNVTIYLFSGSESDEESKIIGAYESTFTVDPTTLKNANFIKFHVLEYSASSDTELGLFLSGLKSYSTKISKPEFISK